MLPYNRKSITLLHWQPALFSLTAFLLNEVMAWIWWSHCQPAEFAQDKRGEAVEKELEDRVECLGVRSPPPLGGLLFEEGASLLSPREWCLCLYQCETTGFHSFLLCTSLLVHLYQTRWQGERTLQAGRSSPWKNVWNVVVP